MWDVTRLLLQKRHDNVLEDISNFSNDLTSLQMESVIGTNKYHQISSSIHILAPPVTSCCRSSPCSPPSASPKSARSRLDDFLGPGWIPSEPKQPTANGVGHATVPVAQVAPPSQATSEVLVEETLLETGTQSYRPCQLGWFFKRINLSEHRRGGEKMDTPFLTAFSGLYIDQIDTPFLSGGPDMVDCLASAHGPVLTWDV